jgi:peptidyl-prolyl cis-trans isomerase D
MATLEKIRNKAGLLVVVVGLALFAFIIGDFLNSGSTYFRQTQEVVAEINGEVVKINDYQGRVDEMTEMYKTQSGQSTLSEEYTTQIRESVFASIVREIVLAEQADQLGLDISSEELFDMVQGENISPMIQQMQMFVNPETGAFDKNALLNFLKTISSDNVAMPAEQQAQVAQARSFWMFWEKNIKQQRLEQKYATLLSKAIVVNAIDAKEVFNETTDNSDIAYAMQSYASIPDSTIKVSDSEIKQLYNDKKELFKQKDSKVIKFLAVDILPSQEDHDNVSKDIEAIKDEFTAAAKVAELVNEYSDVPYIDAFFSASAFDAETKGFALEAEIGEVYGPVFADNKFTMLKLVDKTVAPDSIRVSHIMLPNGDDAATTALVDSLTGVLKAGGDFAALAAQYSVDQTAQNGGELGWFTEVAAARGVSEEFKDVVFALPVNGIDVVKTNYGTHIVKSLEKTNDIDKYKVANVVMSVSPSSKTYSKIYNELNQFVASNSTLDKLTAGAGEAGYNLVSDVPLQTESQMVNNMANTRQVVRWAFNEDNGAVSEIFECNDKFVVAAVQGTIPEGYRPLNLVASSLKSELIAKKKGEQIATELTAKGITSLDQYATAMDARVDTVKFVNFGTRRITGIGVEPEMNAAVSVAAINTLSQPIKGNNGVYIFNVYNKEKDAKAYNEAEQIKSLEASNAYRFSYQAIQSLINAADVKDTRIRFY